TPNGDARKLRKFVEFRKTTLKSLLKVVYGDEFWGPERSFRQGIWPIREYLGVPSSPYFPVYAQEQGPPPMVQERFQIVISQVFQYRIICYGGAIDDNMANIIVSQLLYLDVVDPIRYVLIFFSFIKVML
ncbi:ATP-dependent Clp protease proteolytic subunit 5, chloroplastic-like, partial [Vicia villosa]|uniref:ATP-dependent Clp protease proteolytic subunit 5, chloroplastic-like n=1 Tax=Vicia villosa TaxID=3911 RepID=UPI00273BFF78